MKEMMVGLAASITDAMQVLNHLQQGVVLVVDDQQRLVGTVSDGDIRRAVLNGNALSTPVSALLDAKIGTPYEKPTTATESTPDEEIVRLMHQRQIRIIPIVDEQGRVLRVASITDFITDAQLPVQAVIMAGGFGTRLAPLTDNTPKPMLKIHGRPLMERTIMRLKDAGIDNINITTHYLPEVIHSHFGSGEEFGVRLNYVAEDTPLGTAGSLNLVQDSDEPLLVMNGDILTGVDFRALIDYHRKNNADFTVGVRHFAMEVPYGVIEANDGIVTHLREKPKIDFLVNAGIYLMQPAVRKFIPPSQRFDMTQLIERLIAEGLTVTSFPIIEYWLDIGRHDDFEQAQQDMKTQRWAA